MLSLFAELEKSRPFEVIVTVPRRFAPADAPDVPPHFQSVTLRPGVVLADTRSEAEDIARSRGMIPAAAEIVTIREADQAARLREEMRGVA